MTDIKGGKIEFRVDKHANVHFVVGKAGFTQEQLGENIKAALDEIVRSKPSPRRAATSRRAPCRPRSAPASRWTSTSWPEPRHSTELRKSDGRGSASRGPLLRRPGGAGSRGSPTGVYDLLRPTRDRPRTSRGRRSALRACCCYLPSRLPAACHAEADPDFVRRTCPRRGSPRTSAGQAREVLDRTRRTGRPLGTRWWCSAGPPTPRSSPRYGRARPSRSASSTSLPDRHGRGIAGAADGGGGPARRGVARSAPSAVWLGVNQENVRANRFYGEARLRARGRPKHFLVGGRLEEDFVLERPLP